MIGLKERGCAPPVVPSSNGNVRERTTQPPEKDLNKCDILPIDVLYRSNSSLELINYHSKPTNNNLIFKREYGSHGSIDVINQPALAGTGESFFALLQEYKPSVLEAIKTDQRSPGPSEYLRQKVILQNSVENIENYAIEDGNSAHGSIQSPKLKTKLHKFWGSGSINCSSIKNNKQAMDDSVLSSTLNATSIFSAEAEEIAKRRAFAHYDCQSLTTNLNYNMRIRRNQLTKRRNTTTGASAASMATSTSDGDMEEDSGDGLTNDLIESCPFFRNEIGGEKERIVSLTRFQQNNHQSGKINEPLHRPLLAYGVAVLEFPLGETHWRQSTCPYQRLPKPIEYVDLGALYYRNHFKGLDHQNWFGIDEQLGPVAISIRREKVMHNENQNHSLIQYQYRLVIRTSELSTLRGAILEDAIPNIKASNSSKAVNTKEVLEYVAPEIQISCLRLGIQSPQTEEQLVKLDEQGLTNNYKVGIMYCKAEQSTEEEMYNNKEAGPAFIEFLETVGKTVRLKNFNKYKAGLDNKTDSTGLYSVYSQYQDCEIMFHVSTMLPFTPNNRQQLLRKRHIGNDIVTIVFQEPGAHKFTPKGIRSQFQHVFIIVRAINPCTENTHYKIAVSRSKDVQIFGPPIKKGGIYPKGKAFADFLLAKIVNAENAAHRSEKFVTMATRTRQEYLKDLVTNFSTTTPVDSGQKFSIFSKKKEKIRLRFIPDAFQRGAILWQVLLDDCGQSRQIECFLGISADSFVLLEEFSRQIIFVTPCKSILGWSAQTNSLRIYHHQGECITIHMRDVNCDRDELMEVVERLKAVTQGVNVQELTLKRNIMGQLGFHVQPDGIVTLVESAGQAWQGGLRQNSRLVEICKIAVSTLTYDQMVDLLKTSSCVILTVIPPLPDGTARKGCTLPNCKYNDGAFEDYENLNVENLQNRKAPHGQRAVPGNHRIYEDRSFSPPRSSNSSGYGTGSSSKSFLGKENEMITNAKGDELWYDSLQDSLDLDINSTPNPASFILNRNQCTSSSKRNNVLQIPQIEQSIQNMQSKKVHISNTLSNRISTPLIVDPLTSTEDQSEEVDQNFSAKHRYDKVNMGKRSLKFTDYDVLRQLEQVEASNFYEINDNKKDISHSNGEDLFGSTSKSKHNKHLDIYNPVQNTKCNNTDAKLRPGAVNRSANRKSNSLQQELIRLINPDNIDTFEIDTNLNKPIVQTDNTNTPLPIEISQPEVILTMARPATVISNSSTTSSPLPLEFKIPNNEGMSTSSSPSRQLKSEVLPLPDDMDWPSLVDTATRVMMNVTSSNSDTASLTDDKSLNHWPLNNQSNAMISSVCSSSSLPELQNQVCELELRVSKETKRRMSLEKEIRRLKDENRKLQDQAQAAVQQLRKFTEWFFKNVQRQ